MKTICALIAVFALAGCATKAPPNSAYNQCIDKVAKNPAYAPLQDKMSIGGDLEQTMSMLSDKSHITEEEKPLLLGWAEERRSCYAADDANLRTHVSIELYALINRTRSASLATTVDLYSGKISFGEFAQVRQKIADTHREGFAQLAARDRDAKQARNDQATMMQWQALQNKPAPAPAPMPYMIPTAPTVTTNCTTTAGQVSCTSR